MLFNEPELGLHPYALTLLASLFQQAAQLGRQVIVSTQSAQLLNEFEPEDVVVVERTRGSQSSGAWIQRNYQDDSRITRLSDLWQKNVLGGQPRNEEIPLFSDGDGEAGAAPQKEESGAGDKRP